MCGLTGSVWTRGRFAVGPVTLDRMMRRVAHRGPDAGGQYRAPLGPTVPLVESREDGERGKVPERGVALGFRRLSIIDLRGGHQPMCNEDGSVWITFNGEIYNFRELRQELEARGHDFRTSSDTETIVHLYEEHGLDAFPRLNGMFAIALWDARRRRMILARDRLGQKPLVYRHEAGRLAWASELKSLVEAPEVPRDIDLVALERYLTYQYVPAPETIFAGIRKLPPGHIAVWHPGDSDDGELELHRYWQPDLSERRIDRAEARERVRELLRSSVGLRLQSEVPLGAFLSGGVDSSIVVALMQQQSSKPVQTFSIGFPEARYDESGFAREVAEHLGTEHVELMVTPDAVSILPGLAFHYDEPFADSSAIPTWYVSEMTRRHVTVALSGDGGDELFAGYRRYDGVWLSAVLDRVSPLRRLLGARLWQRLPGADRRSTLARFRNLSRSLGLSPTRRFLDWVGLFDDDARRRLLRPEVASRLDALPDRDPPVRFLEDLWHAAAGRDPVTRASLGDLFGWLPSDLNFKTDIASMAHSLEVRQPFLDHRLVELAISLPISLKYRFGRGKRLLREIFARELPESVFRRPKMGFSVPLAAWFRGDLRDLGRDSLLGEASRTRAWLEPREVERLFEEHDSGRHDHGERLWALLVLELWLREWA